MGLSRAEATLGIIPQAYAEEIARKARAGLLDMAEMKRQLEHTHHPIMPLVRCFQTVCDPPAGEFIHWGATTQDIMDTGAVLQLRDANGVVVRDLAETHRLLCEIARRYKHTVQAGRTHGQQALPITFGYKVAVWAAEVRRHPQRIQEMSPRVFRGQFAGAAGTLASIGEQGFRLQGLMFADLGLAVPEIAWHTARDTTPRCGIWVNHSAATLRSRGRPWRLQRKSASARPSPRALPRGADRRPSRALPRTVRSGGEIRPSFATHSMAEAVCVYAMVGSTLAKIANEIIGPRRTEVAEVEEPFHMGKVGSSTMPHKRNPMMCEGIVAVGKLLQMQVVPALADMVAENERDQRGWQAEWSFLAETCCLLGACSSGPTRCWPASRSIRRICSGTSTCSRASCSART